MAKDRKKTSRSKKERMKIWSQRTSADVVAGALDRAKTDPDAVNQKLWKLTKLVNYLLSKYATTGRL